MADEPAVPQAFPEAFAEALRRRRVAWPGCTSASSSAATR